jgi:hypothetical protein
VDQKASSASADRRTRHLVCLDARLTRADGTLTHSVVSDLSLEGCCVTGRLPIAEKVTVVVPRIGSLTGQVRWSFANRSGIRFARPEAS